MVFLRNLPHNDRKGLAILGEECLKRKKMLCEIKKSFLVYEK